jgi:hypothetical protein
MGRLRTAGVALALGAAFVGLRYLALREEPPVIDTSSNAWTLRESALERARVFVNAPVRPAATGFVPISDTPSTHRPLRCTYVPRPIRGTTPKFDCRLPTGEVVKIKYGANPEVPAEIAATRLLAALGFGADQVAHVAKVECVGCPPHPFRTRQAAEILFMSGLLDRTLNFDRVRSFDHVAVERKFDAEPIEVGDMDGWEWSDLDRVNESRGGASRAELDALRLVAVLLAHWDNKPSNQRFVCLDWPLRDGGSSKTREESECRQPLLMLQDLGATFDREGQHRNWAGRPSGVCRGLHRDDDVASLQRRDIPACRHLRRRPGAAGQQVEPPVRARDAEAVSRCRLP